MSDDRRPPIIHRSIIEDLIFHSAAMRRYTQDSPVLPDVWVAYGEDPDGRVDLLLTPNRSSKVGGSPGAIVRALPRTPEGDVDLPEDAHLAYNQSVVAVAPDFTELVRFILPLAAWRVESENVVTAWMAIPRMSNAGKNEVAAQLVEFELGVPKARGSKRVPLTVLWGIRLVGRIQLARLGTEDTSLVDMRDQSIDPVAKQAFARRLVDAVAGLIAPEVNQGDYVYSISRNRDAAVSVYRSVPTIKADAARGLFPIETANLAWAVIDSGIDARHPAFRRRDRPSSGDPAGQLRKHAFVRDGETVVNNTRVVATYDFTAIRELTDIRRMQMDKVENPALRKRLAKYPKLRDQLLERQRNGDPIRWTEFVDLIRIPHETGIYEPPLNEHGTHVAGILAGDWRCTDSNLGRIGSPDHDLIGVCPALELYDLRVFGPDGRSEEYIVLAAIEFLQDITNSGDTLPIQGVNMSFSIPHDVANYACGRTPVCDDVTRLVNSGLVVVAAAGNDGYVPASAAGAASDAYRTVSISDPGNAEAAITVGSTHGNRPYAYGVSYFSSRGPTGDGRAKPDLVAPGEKIWSAVPDAGARTLDGTSMAAPHVSGCAALLMARYHELIGDPVRIKRILMSTASDLGRESYFQGHGLVDVLRAMQSV